MHAFATVLDIEDRWRPLSPTEKQIAVTLLEDASVRIRAAVPDVDARLQAGTLAEGAARMVAVGMVKRALMGLATGENVVQSSQTAGPFAMSQQYANPQGNLYLTADDLRDLQGRQVGARCMYLA